MKKHLIPLFFVVSFLFANNQTLLPQNFQKKGSEKYHAWWNDRFPDSPLKFKNAKALPLISVKGNRFVNQNGDTIQFHGLAIADPDKLENQGHWSKEIFTKAKRTWNYDNTNTGSSGCLARKNAGKIFKIIRSSC